MYDDIHNQAVTISRVAPPGRCIDAARTCEGSGMLSPRERMVVSAALLIRERGAHATAISDVLEHSGAPRGSAYHYFPGGRMQLLEEAIDYAGDVHRGQDLRRPTSAVELFDDLIDDYRQQLIRSDYRAGCPIVAVTVEAGDPDKPDTHDEGHRARRGGVRALDRSDRPAVGGRRCRRLARRGTRDAGDDVDRGRDRRRPRIPRRETTRPRPASAARPAAGRDGRKETPR